MRIGIWIAAMLAIVAVPVAGRAESSCCRAARASSARAPRTTTTYVRAPRLRTTEPRVLRTSSGHRIVRSEAAKDAFERESGYAGGRKGYVVDHIIPLACGGVDAPSNMQWQTTADGKAKDKVERKGCTSPR